MSATRLLQLLEQSGMLDDSLLGELRKQVVEIAEKWNDNCEMLRQHNLKH